MAFPSLISFDKRPGTFNYIVTHSQVNLMAPVANLPPELAEFRTLLTTFHNIRAPIRVTIQDVLSQLDYLHERRQLRRAMRAQVLEDLTRGLDEALADGMTKPAIMAHVENLVDELIDDTDNRRLARKKSAINSQRRSNQALLAQERSSEVEWNETFEIGYNEYLTKVENGTALEQKKSICENALRWMNGIRTEREPSDEKKGVGLPDPKRVVAGIVSPHETTMDNRIKHQSLRNLEDVDRGEPSNRLPPPYTEVIDVDEAESFYSAVEERPLSRHMETDEPQQKVEKHQARAVEVALRQVSNSSELSTDSARPLLIQRQINSAAQEADTESSEESVRADSFKPTPSPGRQARRWVIESDDSDGAYSDDPHSSEAAVRTPDGKNKHDDDRSDGDSLRPLPSTLRARYQRRIIETDSSSDDDDQNPERTEPLFPSIDYPHTASPCDKLRYILKKGEASINLLPKRLFTRHQRMARNLRRWHFSGTHLSLFPEDTPNKPFVRPKNKDVTMNLYSPYRPLRPPKFRLNGPKPPPFNLTRGIELPPTRTAGTVTGKPSRPVFTTPGPEESTNSSRSSTLAPSPLQEHQPQIVTQSQGQRQYSRPDFAFPQSQGLPSYANSSPRSRGNKRRRLTTQLASRSINREW